MKIIKISLICFGLLFLIAVGFLLGSNWYYQAQESKFYNIELPKGHDLKKTIDFLNYAQIDFLESTLKQSSNIEAIGTGYTGYDFYMWHKPTAKGEIYLKAYEVTTNTPLTQERLTEGTRNQIIDISSKYKLYKGQSTIYEGTFEKYYPARFELWFKSSDTGLEKKITERVYLIDGWDR